MLADVNDKSIEEKGERMVPAFHKGTLVYGEHLTRYESVADLLKDKVVLDIASGSGYGSYILAEKAVKVYGVDIDRESVSYANRNYSRDNIEFLEGSGETIPLKDKSVDAVVTFETIEHIKNYKKFLAEIKRVLKPAGLLIISTPNDAEFPEGNHFHLHEFKYQELKDLLKQYFKNVRFSYQYTWLFVGLMEQETAERDGKLDMEVSNYTKLPKDKAIYFMAVCSDDPLSGKNIKSLGALSQHYSARSEKEERDLLNNKINSMHNKINSMHNLLEEKGQIESQLVSQLRAARAELQHIHSSKGWRLLSIIWTAKSRLNRVFRRR